MGKISTIWYIALKAGFAIAAPELIHGKKRAAGAACSV
jgi:hypothetical protein